MVVALCHDGVNMIVRKIVEHRFSFAPAGNEVVVLKHLKLRKVS